MKVLEFKTKTPELSVETKPQIGYTSGPARCANPACNHSWVAVIPTGVNVVECPKCNLTTGFRWTLVEFDDDHWKCACGCLFFNITRKLGTYCVVCGKVVDWTALENS